MVVHIVYDVPPKLDALEMERPDAPDKGGAAVEVSRQISKEINR